MPHCIIEYSKNIEQQIEVSDLLEAAYQGALESELFNPADIKCRAIAYEHYTSGDDVSGFVHVTVKILEGRSQEQRNVLSSMIFQHVKKQGLAHTSLTVEIVDINAGSYMKALS